MPLCLAVVGRPIAIWALLTSTAVAADRLVGPGEEYETIQAAYDEADSGDVLLVQPGDYAEDLQLDAKDIEIVGVEGSAATLLIGATADNLVTVSGFSVQLTGVTVDAGGAARSFRVLAGGQLTLDDVVSVGSAPTDGLHGGAVRVEGGGLTLTNTSFDDTVDVGVAYGGHIAVIGGAVDGGQGVSISGGSAARGGAIYATGGVVDLQGAWIYDNAAPQIDVDGGTLLGSEVLVQGGVPGAAAVRAQLASVVTWSDGDFLGSAGIELIGVTDATLARNLFCAPVDTAVHLVDSGGRVHNNLVVETVVSDPAAHPGAVTITGLGAVDVDNNHFLGGEHAGALYASGGSVVATNNLVASFQHLAYPAFAASDAGSLVLHYNAFWDNTVDTTQADDGSNLFGLDPLLLDYMANGDCADDNFRPAPESPLVDGGVGLDRDGSDADIGVYGGPDAPAACFADADGDGYGGTPVALPGLTCAEGELEDDTDCDDTRPEAYPGAFEACDAVDNDCNTVVDEGWPLTTWYADSDGDGYGDAAVTTQACPEPSGFVADATDCNDADGDTYPGADETCDDTVDQDCDGLDLPCVGLDQDGDGFCWGETCDAKGALPGDCDDADTATNPWAPEVCDSVDNDCDGLIDELLTADEDGDGYSTPTSCAGTQDDCNDLLDFVNVDAPELCNLIDDNCDGVVDDGLVVDADGDGFPFGGGYGCPGFAVLDCDDTHPGIHPAAMELVGNGFDDNCNGLIDEYSGAVDDDGDGYCEAVGLCDDGSLTGDCDDSDPSISPAAEEVPDGVDNNCSGVVDDLGTLDRDRDGWSARKGDCNDLDATVNPDAEEVCNGYDDDCDGLLPFDELDLDGDGVLVCAGDCDDTDSSVRPGLAEDCTDAIDHDCDGLAVNDTDADGDGFSACAGDCDDANADVFPGAPELCNGIDDDCDLQVDEDFDADGDGALACGACDVDPCDCNDQSALQRPGAVEVCGDAIDNDCDGSLDAEDNDFDGYTTCDGDCNDDDVLVHVGAAEWCDGVDNDCDGLIDEGYDADNDGVFACRGDCLDSHADTYIGAEEACDDIDNDCNGVIDDPFPDVDGDGYTPCNGDCLEGDADVHPGVGVETACDDGIDDDCDGVVDAEDPDCRVIPPEQEEEGGPKNRGGSTEPLPSSWFCAATPGAPGPVAWLVAIAVALRRRIT